MKKRRSSHGDETIFRINDENKGVFDPAASKNKRSKNKPPKADKPAVKGKNVGSEPGEREPVGLRIIGGTLRGSKLQYIGDRRVRPMKDRVREAVFNLIGPEIKGRHVVDLFGGTGALTIEAISRGAVSATVVELHLPTAALLRTNLDGLGLLDRCELRKTDAFFWAKDEPGHPAGPVPWIVFCSPPYDFYIEREAEMLDMLRTLVRRAPNDSMFVIESDERFDFDRLPVMPPENKVRVYAPAKVGIFRTG